ncbi:outer membrane protein OmpK [Endozoicomonas ascidiicola]|uniref:nucleoside-specific channel-forming Tsx family protein n=1 Tax=Endozoicomonas ascidiicola TaxID=1698521 RepID=UPI00082C08FC|nr:outer membrane protein OmpK [Endozoicomonas ascidiicola]
MRATAYPSFYTTILVLSLALGSGVARATDFNDGSPPNNDFMWMNLNLMYAYKELPRQDHEKHDGHDYFELEFGGRSGFLQLYGYVDVFNLANQESSDKYGKSKMFMKLNPRFSVAGLFDSLPWGPVKDIYFATLFNWGGGGATNFGKDIAGNDIALASEDTNTSFWGIGTDMQVPWFGLMGFNLYAMYDFNYKDWNGYQVTTNWFTPFVHFDNGSFIAYQGYLDYQFGGKTSSNKDSVHYDKNFKSNGGQMFNGLYWHFDKFALGYGLKLYSNTYLIKDNGDLFGTKNTKSSGASHYFAVSYKF